MFSIDDYILVDRDGSLFKISIRDLGNVFLPVDDNDFVEELTEKIEDLSSYITDLSAEIIEEYTPISELSQKYELKLSTDYMLEDPNILEDEGIERKIKEAGLVPKEVVDDAFDNEVEKCEKLFQRAYKSTGTWFQ